MEITRITDKNAEYFADLCPEAFFQNENYIRLGVIHENEPVSACALDVNDKMVHIHWLYTDPEKREMGAAAFLMEKVLELLDGLSLDGIEIDFDAEDDGLDAFLMEQEFMVGDERSLYRVPLTELIFGARMDAMLARRSQTSLIHPLEDADADAVNHLKRLLKLYDLGPEYLQGISTKYSFIVNGSEGTETGTILTSETEEGDLHINYLIGGGSPQEMLDLVAVLYDALIRDEKYDGDLVFSDRLGTAVTFIEMMTGNEGEHYRVSGPMYALKLFV